MDNFLDEASEVQLQLLTATVKLFLKKPSSGPQSLIQMVLQQATTDTDDPDLRDRAYIYWRLLSSDPEAAKEVVLASKPMIRDDRNTLDADLLNQLLHQISTLSSVYYKLPAVFVPRSRISLDEDDEHTGDTVTSRSPEVLSKPRLSLQQKKLASISSLISWMQLTLLFQLQLCVEGAMSRTFQPQRRHCHQPPIK